MQKMGVKPSKELVLNYYLSFNNRKKLNEPSEGKP